MLLQHARLGSDLLEGLEFVIHRGEKNEAVDGFRRMSTTLLGDAQS